MFLKLPIRVFAELDGKWSLVLGINMQTTDVLLERDGKQVTMPAVQVLQRNLLWPDGTRVNMAAVAQRP